ncbi:MAG: 1-(5-phosphoribosyl)-5-[(5-phosphoribosylamino)methylideneamino]imidazole-4-carboxamide isomerase [Gammaproteobacteria bacterium]|nr:1-(5-phosphoribosyl)-5-[(5-phosphoribosylamino)methylideneamino]imidazole-4-carboxamide isomerase [Gammaproteobacteria bacterium]
MILIPAIDLHDGQCVQLQRGLLDTATIYDNDAGRLAEHWIEQGAQRLHVVDLDGAFSGQSENNQSIRAIIQAAGDTPVQLGGGIRDMTAVSTWIDAGIAQVCIGTQAIEDFDFFAAAAEQYPNRIILALDARGGFVSTRGWQTATNVSVRDVLVMCADLPLFAIVFTDIESDGMMTGVNLKRTEQVLADTHIPVIASGGVRGIVDLENLLAINVNDRRVYGAISGSALYEKMLDFRRGVLVLKTHS